MFVKDLINYSLPFLKSTDSVSEAIEMMEDFKIDQMAYSNGSAYFGIFTKTILENFTNPNQLLDTIEPNFTAIYLFEDQHIFEAIKLIQTLDIQTIAVLDKSFVYKGNVTSKDILLNYSKLLGNQEIGAIINLEVNSIDYSLAEIARLVESNNIKILSSTYTSQTLNEVITHTLTLKLNTQEISKLIATFDRYGYHVLNVFANEPIQTSMKENYDMLMKYLEI